MQCFKVGRKVTSNSKVVYCANFRTLGSNIIIIALLRRHKQNKLFIDSPISTKSPIGIAGFSKNSLFQ